MNWWGNQRMSRNQSRSGVKLYLFPVLLLPILLFFSSPASARFYFLETDVRALDTSKPSTLLNVLTELRYAVSPDSRKGKVPDFVPLDWVPRDPQGAIIGEDERSRVEEEAKHFIPAIGQVLIFVDGERYVCTGTLVSPQHVLTAGHCLSSEEGWAERVLFIPGRNGSKIEYGIATGEKAILLKGWSEYQDDDYDIGMIKLTKPLEFKTLSVEQKNKSFFRSEETFYTVGYPGDQPDGTLWIASSPRHRPYRLNQLLHYIDTSKGQSGAPIFYKANDGDFRIVGIHTGSFSSVNGGIRFNSIVLESLSRWISNQ